MAETDPVEIVVDIAGSFREELGELRTELEKIDNMEISPDLDIDAADEIKKVQAQLKKLKKEIEADLDIDVDGQTKAQTIKSALSKDMRSTLHIDTQQSGLPPPARQAVASATETSLGAAAPEGVMDDNKFGRSPTAGFGLDISPRKFMPQRDFMGSEQEKWLRMMQPSRPSTSGGSGGDIPTPTGSGMGDLNVPGLGRDSSDGFDFSSTNRKANAALKRLGRTVNKLRPNIMMVWNALAALIPVFVTLGAAAIGLAGGMIAIATAGAAILGLGLLGWGEDFQSSLQAAKEEAMSLGSRLFDVLQPVADVAQPVLRDWMQGAPRQVQKLVGPLQNLIEAFEGPLGDMGAGIADWIAEVIQSMASMDGIIAQITQRFGRVAGAFLIDFMENMVVFAYENQDALIQMAHALRMVGRTLLRVSIFVVRLLAVLAPFIDLVAWLSNLLTNRWVAAFTASTIAAIGLVAALTSLAAMLEGTFLGIGGLVAAKILAIAGSMGSAITTAYQFAKAVATVNGQLSILRALLLSIGVGLVIGAAGYMAHQAASTPSPAQTSSRRRAGSGGAGNTVIIEGDVGKTEMDRLMDRMGPAAREEQSVSQQRER